MIIDCTSDLHGHFPKLDGGDLLIIAGDITASDDYDHILEFKEWYRKQQYKKIVHIAGNHDNWIQKRFAMAGQETWDHEKFAYLEDSGTEFDGLKIWGMPWTTTFPGMNPLCKAFTRDTEKELQQYVEMIPDDTDILVTHGPPHYVLDKTSDGREVGHGHLYGYLRYVIRPQLHVYGHIHESYGQIEYFSGCISVNASHMNEHCEPVNPAIRIIL